MANLEVNIVMNKNHMDSITLDFNHCAQYVGDIFTEAEKMKQIMEESYKGYASEGLEDFFVVLEQHLELLQQCYKQLANYTKITKEVFLETDKLIGLQFLQGGMSYE